MKTIALLIKNENERQVLEHYFKSLRYQVLALDLEIRSFWKIIDAQPLCVICEIPRQFIDTLKVIRLLSNQNKKQDIPVIAYGNHTALSVIKSFYNAGVECYYQRPLQIKLLLRNIDDIKKGITIDIRQLGSSSSNIASVYSAGKNKQQSGYMPQKSATVTPTSETKNRNALTVDQDELDAVAMLMNPMTPPDERIEIIIGRVSEMLAFPFTIVKILEITQNDQTGATDLARAIEADPVIVSSLLSISNTVHYARQGKRIDNVQEAIIRLGFVETKNIALSLSVLNMFSKDAKSEGFDRFEFWYHSLACGILSEIFARKAGLPNPEKAFICGLLHDFGIILLDEFFHAFFTSVYNQVAENKSSFVAEEKRLWGMSHNSAVAQLFKNWNIPQEITHAISQQDLFSFRQSIDRNNRENILAYITGFSNILAKALQLGKDCDDIIFPVHKSVPSAFGFSNETESSLLGNCIERLNIYTDFFNLEKKNFKYPPDKKPEIGSLSVVEHTKEMFFPHKFYLEMCGYSVRETLDTERRSLKEKPPGAILNLINSSIPEKYLEPFVNIPHVTPDGEPEQFVPAIFFSLNKKRELNLDSLSNVYSMPAEVNMPVFRAIIDKMISRTNGVETDETIVEMEPVASDKVLSVNYLNETTMLISLCGIIRLNCFNEIRGSLLNALEQKTPAIAIQVNDIVDIDSLMTNLLVNFQKKTAETNSTLCFCSIGKEIPEVLQHSESLKSILQFNHEDELITWLHKESDATAS